MNDHFELTENAANIRLYLSGVYEEKCWAQHTGNARFRIEAYMTDFAVYLDAINLNEPLDPDFAYRRIIADGVEYDGDIDFDTYNINNDVTREAYIVEDQAIHPRPEGFSEGLERAMREKTQEVPLVATNDITKPARTGEA